jgi:hypothetical protein
MYPMPSAGYASITGAMNDRMTTTMRLILAASALLIFYIDPSEPDRHVALAYATLALYVIYSALLVACAWRRILLVPATITHWVDLGWYAVLISLSSGTNSIFFFFFFFAILIASFRWGFGSGLRVVCTSAALFCIIGFATTPAGADFDLNRLMLRPISLLVLGYMVAYWGNSELTLKWRLTLLKDINTLSNTRFGVDRTLGAIMEQLRAFYDADICLLIMTDLRMSAYSMRRVDRRDPEAATRSEPIAEELAHLLLTLPATQAMIARHAPRLWRWWHPEAGGRAYDVATGKCVVVPLPVSGVLAAESFITVPVTLIARRSGGSISRHRDSAPSTPLMGAFSCRCSSRSCRLSRTFGWWIISPRPRPRWSVSGSRATSTIACSSPTLGCAWGWRPWTKKSPWATQT